MEVYELGNYAMIAMDKIKEDFGDDVDIRTLSIVVEVDTEERPRPIVAYCDDDRPWVQIEFLSQALDVLNQENEVLFAADEDEYGDPRDDDSDTSD